ncbi:hypothetical protein KU306_07240 [Haloferax larsenii]|uniref:Uncharacterized protein n=1 Tax=Haloferax larsenii TaxID=302484 RepID=A0ABY5RHZ1_HALLR|nr:hypothetical protein [Haloferax larsenii]UVE51655.1 hypothetical protein KU306_07240 [Haloferax larsenii]
MRTESRESVTDLQSVSTFDDLTGYEDGRAFVICDTKNPNAWIRSDETRPVSD